MGARMSDDDKRHGTPAGHAAHKRALTEPCEPCRTAFNDRQKQARTGTRSMRRCKTCTNRTEARDQVCRGCKAERRLDEVPDVDSGYELTGGQWVPRDGIMRWEAA